MSNHIFSFLATPVFAYIHIQHQPCPYVNLQHNYSLVSNNNFTFNANIHVHFLQPIWHLFCVLFLSTASRNYFASTFQHPFLPAFSFFFFIHVSQQLNNLFHFSFLQPFANKQPSNSFFLATSLPTAIFVFYFQAFSTVFLPFSPLVFLGSDVLSANGPSWRGAVKRLGCSEFSVLYMWHSSSIV